MRMFAVMILAALLVAGDSRMPAVSSGQAMPEASEFRSGLVEAYRAMSPGDRSTLHVMTRGTLPRDAPASLMTTQGSPNDVFWTLLSTVGLSEPGKPNKELSEALPTIRMWKLTENGAKVVPGLVRWLEATFGVGAESEWKLKPE